MKDAVGLRRGFPLVFADVQQTAGAFALIAGMYITSNKIVGQDEVAVVDGTPRVRFGGDRILIEGRF